MRNLRWGLVACALCALAMGCAGESGGGGGDGGGGGGGENCVDKDGDGVQGGPGCRATPFDCNDNDRNVSPNKPELPGNGKDDDCQGGDAPPADPCPTQFDQDNDNYMPDPAPAGAPAGCRPGDCDDRDPQVNPGRQERVGNGKDDDCNAETKDQRTNCTDEDGDGYGTEGHNDDCDNGGADKPFDCDDKDKDAYPTATEKQCDGKDNNCDGNVDECPNASQVCDAERKVCLGEQNAACQGHLDCTAKFRCKDGQCKAWEGEACGQDSDCFSGACDVGQLKCAGNVCEVLKCEDKGNNQCGVAKVCKEELGKCVDCEDSADGGLCDCGYCAGYKCFDANGEGQGLNTPIADSEEANNPPIAQLVRALVSCFGGGSDDRASLCGAIYAEELSVDINEDSVDDYVCGDEVGNHFAADEVDRAKDMIGGCGFGGIFDADELEFVSAIQGGGYYLDCIWYDGRVKAGDCKQFPSDI